MWSSKKAMRRMFRDSGMAALIGGAYVFNAPFSKGSPLVITAAARHDTPLKLEVAVTPYVEGVSASGRQRQWLKSLSRVIGGTLIQICFSKGCIPPPLLKNAAFR